MREEDADKLVIPAPALHPLMLRSDMLVSDYILIFLFYFIITHIHGERMVLLLLLSVCLSLTFFFVNNFF